MRSTGFSSGVSRYGKTNRMPGKEELDLFLDTFKQAVLKKEGINDLFYRIFSNEQPRRTNDLVGRAVVVVVIFILLSFFYFFSQRNPAAWTWSPCASSPRRRSGASVWISGC